MEGELGTAQGEHVIAGGGGGGGIIVQEIAIGHCFALGVLGASDAKTSHFSHALTNLDTAVFVMITLLVVAGLEASGEDGGFVIARNIANGTVATWLDHTHGRHVRGLVKGGVDGV